MLVASGEGAPYPFRRIFCPSAMPAGMVMRIEPVDNILTHLKSERHYDEIIYTSPDGEMFDQKMANSMSMLENIIILCGHYKGIDHRIREHLITREVSVGNFVLTGGELAASIMADAIVRIIPGVISDEQSALSDCFQDDLLSSLCCVRRLLHQVRRCSQ